MFNLFLNPCASLLHELGIDSCSELAGLSTRRRCKPHACRGRVRFGWEPNGIRRNVLPLGYLSSSFSRSSRMWRSNGGGRGQGR